MAYRLKSIRYGNEPHHILLQNENGPCPLLAAANVLLLKKSIVLPSNCIGAGVVTIEQLTNILAEKILTNHQGNDASDHHIQEVMTIFPNLQFGMDVNPKFTAGPTGVEYTLELNAFDLLRVDLVHGWLLEPDAQEYEWVGTNTYNQLINLVIEGNDASAKLQQAATKDRKDDDDDDKNDDNDTDNKNVNDNKNDDDADAERDALSNKATRGAIVKGFLDRSAHQLTQHGLMVLHEFVGEGDLVVFFRNNHFNTLTKHGGSLYLLVTDFGYADVGSVVWEKLDVIDGDTEYVTERFAVPPPLRQHHLSDAATGEHLAANDARSRADYQLALQLSRESGGTTAGTAGAAVGSATTMAINPADGPSAPTVVMGVPVGDVSQEESDMMLALQLQRQEEQREARLQQQRQRDQGNRTAQQRARGASKDSNCIIM